MYIRSLLRLALRVIAPLAFVSTFYLYLYPIFHGCVFPTSDGVALTAFRDTLAQHLPSDTLFEKHGSAFRVPFRLLVLADPQLEGDSSLPKPEDGFLPRVKDHWQDAKALDSKLKYLVYKRFARKVLFEEIPRALNTLRKRVDLFGNDYYLAHIYRTLSWWTKPTHITVLGDLIGSQWVKDDEFHWRGWRFWNRVFAGGRRVEDEITTLADGEAEKVVAMDDEAWKTRIINIAGNHDIGYAGDISEKRMERFESVFGKANWDVRFRYPTNANSTTDNEQPTLHMIVLNSLILDTPALSEDIQGQTYDYINSIVSSRVRPVEDRSSFTLLLTHVPLHKKAGVCIDAPMFDFWGSDTGGGVYKPHSLKEQNHLSEPVSQKGTLEALFGMRGDLSSPAQGKGRNGVILTGHDHEGCDVFHYVPVNSTWTPGNDNDDDEGSPQNTQWEAVRWQDMKSEDAHTGVREVTLRSMMGEFGGNAGLLSAWFDFEVHEWKYDIQMCKLGVQHIWWAIHVIDIVAVVLLCLSIITGMVSPARPKVPPVPAGQKGVTQKKTKRSPKIKK